MAEKITEADFEGFEITWKGDVFRDAPQQTDAAAFGMLGITYRAYKPEE